jgi:uncharacterized membrane protein YwaF
MAVLLVAHFAVPLLLLLSRALKRDRRALSAVAILILVAHAADMTWLVLPANRPAGGWPLPLDLGPFLFVGGVLAAATRARLGPVPAALFGPSLAYRSP